MFLKISQISTVWKHLCWSIFLIKLHGLTTSEKGVFLWNLRILQKHVFLQNTSSGCSCVIDLVIEVNESRYNALFVVSGFIEKLFSWLCQYFCFLNIFFNRFLLLISSFINFMINVLTSKENERNHQVIPQHGCLIHPRINKCLCQIFETKWKDECQKLMKRYPFQ